MEEEYVYVNSTIGLWRLRFDGKKLEGPVEGDKGEVTQLCSYRDIDVPLGAGLIRWKSKVFFVGGEKLLPNDNPGDGEEQPHLLNRLVYVCEDQHQDWAADEPRTSISLSSALPCEGSKAIPFVFPVKSRSGTLFCVIGRRPLLRRVCWAGPVFEIFDPESEEWLETPQQPFREALAGSYSAFEFDRRIFLIGIGQVEASFSLQTRQWEKTEYFLGPQGVFPPMRTVAVDGLSQNIRIGIANCDGNVYAYKLLHRSTVAMQPLPQVQHYYAKRFPDELPVELSLSSLGNGVVLFITSSFHGCGHYYVHYHCLKIHFTELSTTRKRSKSDSDPAPFVKAEVVDCCRRTLPMSYKDMHDVALHIGMRSAFLL